MHGQALFIYSLSQGIDQCKSHLLLGIVRKFTEMASVECSEENEECTRLVFEAVNNNSVSSFRDARHRYGAIKLLTSLAECNEEGETPLAIAFKRNYVSDVVEEIKRFLKFVLELCHDVVEHQLKLKLAINQLLLHQIPIKELINFLIHED